MKKRACRNEVQVIMTGCFGFCEKGPVVKVMPDNTFYVQVKPEDAPVIVAEHVIKGRAVQRLLYADPKSKEHISRLRSTWDFTVNRYVSPCATADSSILKILTSTLPVKVMPLSASAVSELTPAEVVDIDQEVRPARTRWCRIPDRTEVGDSIKEQG
ncbi:MAG: hypothetical protein MZV63_02000 [Marinilabiliales bacterium]|nr:hypothetical protein [Marinilabiliales bacterium]